MITSKVVTLVNLIAFLVSVVGSLFSLMVCAFLYEKVTKHGIKPKNTGESEPSLIYLNEYLEIQSSRIDNLEDELYTLREYLKEIKEYVGMVKND